MKSCDSPASMNTCAYGCAASAMPCAWASRLTMRVFGLGIVIAWKLGTVLNFARATDAIGCM